jgi:hypothetical protein
MSYAQKYLFYLYKYRLTNILILRQDEIYVFEKPQLCNINYGKWWMED